MALANKKVAKQVEMVDSPTSTEAVLIFISHDSRDADIAEAFAELLSKAGKGNLTTFYASDRKGEHGIKKGANWYSEVIKHIQSASDIVCLLTPRSVDGPWVFYEAGMAVEKSVVGVALGLPVKLLGSGPFAQLQNCPDDAESLTTLVVQLLERVPGIKPKRHVIGKLVRNFLKNVSRSLEKYENNEPRRSEPGQDFESFVTLGMEVVHDPLEDENLRDRLAGAKSIRVLKTWFPETDQIRNGLEEAIKKGAKVRLLLCNPSSILLQSRSLTALRREWKGPHMVYQAIEDICAWLQSRPDTDVQIALYDSWPAVPVIWYDDQILMGFYFRGKPSPAWPWIAVRKECPLAKILNRQFDELWDLDDTELLDSPEQMTKWLKLKRNKKWAMSQPLAPRRHYGNSSNRSRLKRKAKA